jgi:hypothetical protein
MTGLQLFASGKIPATDLSMWLIYFKVCYLNRTWEQYTYQTVIHRLIEKSEWLTDEEKADCLAILK